MLRPVAATVLTLALAPVASRAESPPVAAESELRDLVSWFSTDRQALGRRYPVDASPERLERRGRFLDEWQKRVEAVDFEPLGVEGRIDHVLLRNRIDYEKRLLAREEGSLREAWTLLPFAVEILAMNDARIRMETMDAPKAAAALAEVADRVTAFRNGLEGRIDSVDRLAAFRAQEQLGEVEDALESWYGFYADYDPLFTWWASAPYGGLTDALGGYRSFLRERVLGISAGGVEPIVGTPIGSDALVYDLLSEFIPYSPDDLLAIADREFAWCEEELRKAAREMGFGDDVMAAIEKVKTLYVPPG